MGQRRSLVTGIPGERCCNKFRVICGDIKHVKTTNSQGAAKQKINQVSLLHDNARPHKGGSCSGGVGCSTLSSLQYEFFVSIFDLFGMLKDAP